MAFCNSCGAALTPGTTLCNKCGAAIAGASPVPAVAATAPGAGVPAVGSSGLKVILIVAAVIVGIAILCIVTVAFVGYHFAKNSHVSQEGDKVRVETPFGVFSANDPEQAAQELGVEIYPGAEVQKNGAASVNVAGIHTVTANFKSSDPVDKVCSFYKSKFPRSTVASSDQNRCTIASSEHGNSITINVEGSGDGSRFQVANVTRKASSSN